VSLTTLTPTVPTGFEFLLAPMPPAQWGLEYPLVERAAHYLSASTLITRPFSQSVTVRVCSHEDCQTLVTGDYCSIHKSRREAKSFKLDPAAKGLLIIVPSLPPVIIKADPLPEHYPLGDIASYGRDGYPQWSWSVERSLDKWVASQAPPAFSDPNYRHKENITNRANRKHIKRVPANNTEHIMVGNLQRMQQTSTETFYTVEDKGLVEHEPQLEDSAALVFDDELKSNPDHSKSGASRWFSTSRVWTEYEMRHDKGTYFEPAAEYDINYEVSQGLPNLETTDTRAINTHYENGSRFLAAQRSILDNVVPIKGKRFNTPSAFGEVAQGSRRSGDWLWFVARPRTLEEIAEKDWEKWNEKVGIDPEPFIGQHFIESERTNFPDLGKVRDRMVALFNPKMLTRADYEAEVRKHRDFQVQVVKYHQQTSNTPYAVQIGAHNMVKITQQIHRAGERAEQALLDKQATEAGVAVDFTKAINMMPTDEVHATVCQGGYFIVVTLNNRPELKKLAPLGTPEDEVETAFEQAQKASIANAIKQARKTARANGLGSKATADAVEQAKARVTAAFDAVGSIFVQDACPHHSVLQPELTTAQ
jgi:hypothetical protein